MNTKTDKNNQTKLYINRELSWIEFNRRVLELGLDSSIPLLERLKFLAISDSNFDEFFMVRVASLFYALDDNTEVCPSGIAPSTLLKEVHGLYADFLDQQYKLLKNSLIPELKDQGLIYCKPENFDEAQLNFAQKYFEDNLFPLLTPVRFDDNALEFHPGNHQIHCAYMIRSTGNKKDYITTSSTEDEQPEALVLISIPKAVSRIIQLPSKNEKIYFCLVEDLVDHFSNSILVGFEIKESCFFRFTRDADFAVDEKSDLDLLEAMESVLHKRERSQIIRMMVNCDSQELIDKLIERFQVQSDFVFNVHGPLQLKDFMRISLLPGYEQLKYKRWAPLEHADLTYDQDVFEQIAKQDVLLFHPFHSFFPIIKFLNSAADDNNVLAIKMTLYRTSGDSPLIEALERAARNGKQVTVLVELKARFDEQQNISWAQQLEQAGVIVIYGISRLKVHAKALLVVRKESAGIKRYLHISSGNYNDSTAKLYTDVGLMTSNDELCYEAGLFFNAITGYSAIPSLNQLSIAPVSMKKKLLYLINREKQRSNPENPGLIMAKINAIADPEIIGALYEASQAHVQIRLSVRGICMLRPGIKGLSENIEVNSIIDRYLEHSRIVYFQNGGKEEVFISSADWMPRNLDRRVELLIPVLSDANRRRLKKLMEISLSDTTNAWTIGSDGTSHRIKKTGKKIESQFEYYEFYKERSSRQENAYEGSVFQVQRKQ